MLDGVEGQPPPSGAKRRPLRIMVVVDSAVESLETKSPLSTTGRYAKAEHGGVMGEKPISDLQGLAEAIPSPGHA